MESNGSGVNTSDIRNKLWMGIVEDVKDPNRKGRIKVRVQGLYNNLSTEDIPYASPYLTGADGREFRLPAVGKIVNVVYPFNNLYDPYYVFSENYNINLTAKLKDMEDDEYEKFVALLFDDRTQVYSDDKNLTLDYNYNKITIDNDRINLELKDNSKSINLGTEDASQQAILGNHFMEWLDDLVKILEKPTSLIGNMGSAILKPQVDIHLKKYHLIRETFLSMNVNIVDNYEVKTLI